MGAGDVTTNFLKVYRPSPNDGTVSGGVTIDDEAMVFDNVANDQWITVTKTVDFAEGAFSIWFKADAIADANEGRIINKEANNGFYLQQSFQNNKIILVLRNNTGASQLFVMDNLPLSDDILITFSWNSTHITLYVNGVFYSSTAITNSWAPNFADFAIGGRSERAFNGKIYSTLLFNKQVSLAEHTQIYDAGKDAYSPVTAGLVAQYSGRDYLGSAAVPTTILDSKVVSNYKTDNSFIDAGIQKLRVNANSKFLLAPGHRGQVYVTHIEEAA